MKLELKHLSPYFPYGLQIQRFDGDTIEVNPYNLPSAILENFKPVLRQLSDLTKEIEVNGERFVPIEWFEIGDDDNGALEYDHGNILTIQNLEVIAKYNVWLNISYLPFGIIQKLLEWHFDVFGLIEQGLAIDINTLTSQTV